MPFKVSSGRFCTWNQNAADFKSKGFYDPASFLVIQVFELILCQDKLTKENQYMYFYISLCYETYKDGKSVILCVCEVSNTFS